MIALCSSTVLEAPLDLHTSLAPGFGVEYVDLAALLGQVDIVGADTLIVLVVVAAEESSTVGVTKAMFATSLARNIAMLVHEAAVKEVNDTRHCDFVPLE